MDELRKFLITGNKDGYAAGESNITREDDKSYSIRFEQGSWRYHDNWFGGEPFGGRTVVFKAGKPYWMAVYYGSDSGKAEGLIGFLRKALSNQPDELPVRGPKELKEDKFEYKNKWEGDLEKFSGKEFIYYDGEEVYSAEYAGGLVDQREDQM